MPRPGPALYDVYPVDNLCTPRPYRSVELAPRAICRVPIEGTACRSREQRVDLGNGGEAPCEERAGIDWPSARHSPERNRTESERVLF
jgi:hypothetical protein